MRPALDTVLEVLERQPAPPRLLNAKVDRELEGICLKCLEKDPRHRYPSALALANFSSVEAVAITVAPSSLAICTAALPTPLPAA